MWAGWDRGQQMKLGTCSEQQSRAPRCDAVLLLGTTLGTSGALRCGQVMDKAIQHGQEAGAGLEPRRGSGGAPHGHPTTCDRYTAHRGHCMHNGGIQCTAGTPYTTGTHYTTGTPCTPRLSNAPQALHAAQLSQIPPVCHVPWVSHALRAPHGCPTPCRYPMHHGHPPPADTPMHRGPTLYATDTPHSVGTPGLWVRAQRGYPVGSSPPRGAVPAPAPRRPRRSPAAALPWKQARCLCHLGKRNRGTSAGMGDRDPGGWQGAGSRSPPGHPPHRGRGTDPGSCCLGSQKGNWEHGLLPAQINHSR